jgi:SAM-dependent methyltransferase
VSVHRAAATGFARAAAEYARGRPGYPVDALALLIERLALGPGRVVLDLAAGTGALSRPLVETGAEVIAVEPVDEMRAALPGALHALKGTAEEIPLEAGTVDAVTVAQAFHWFDGEAALAEIHRVLRPGGALALVWNRRLDDDPVNREIDALLAPHRAGVPTLQGDAWRSAFERGSLFGPLDEHVFANEQLLDADGLADRVGSISFIASLPEAERGGVLARARGLAAGGAVRVPYRTELFTCERRH